jgi:N-acetyltransferase 10
MYFRMNSLKQLYAMSMDIHLRYRTEAHQDVVARFNERFISSLGSCAFCPVLDDEMNVLPISGGKGVTVLPPPDADQRKTQTPAQKELETIIRSDPLGPWSALPEALIKANALLTLVEAISENLESLFEFVFKGLDQLGYIDHADYSII